MRTDCCLFIFTSLFASCWLFCLQASGAANNLTVGQVMRDWDFLESSNKCFRLRFFISGLSSSRYLGIQYMNLTYTDWDNGGRLVEKMVWVANRDDPLADSSGVLNILPDGKLVITNQTGTFFTINSQQSTSLSSSNVSLTLLNTGNLVLTEGSRILWQSFDYPSDTWLPGMKLGLFRSTEGQPPHQRILTSWVSNQVPNLGAFTFGVDPNNTKQLVIWKRGVIYWRSGIWNGYNFSYFPLLYDSTVKFNYFSNDSQSYFTFTTSDNNSTQLFDIHSSGSIYMFEKFVGGWSYGPISYCDDGRGENSSKACEAPEPSNCTTGDVFTWTGGSMSNWIYSENVSLGISDCKDMCTKDCSCTAYASASSDGSGCKLSDGTNDNFPYDFFYLRNSTTVNPYSSILYPVPSSAPTYPPSWYSGDWHTNPPNHTTPNNSNKRKLALPVGVAVALLVIATLTFFACYLWRRKHHFGGNNGKSKDRTSQSTVGFYELRSEAIIIDKVSNVKKNHELPLFTLSSIEIATDFFSDENKIGQGGFGPVYKGKLVNGEEIAVKRLSRSSGQGLEEFENEVMLISRLQHRNLVRLLGCCTQGDERILIYEYMPNKSLDSFLFGLILRCL